MVHSVNIEAEHNELILKSDNGDYAIIPADKRETVKKLLAKKDHNGITKLINSLPTVDQYEKAQNGMTIPKTLLNSQQNEAIYDPKLAVDPIATVYANQRANDIDRELVQKGQRPLHEHPIQNDFKIQSSKDIYPFEQNVFSDLYKSAWNTLGVGAVKGLGDLTPILGEFVGAGGDWSKAWIKNVNDWADNSLSGLISDKGKKSFFQDPSPNSLFAGLGNMLGFVGGIAAAAFTGGAAGISDVAAFGGGMLLTLPEAYDEGIKAGLPSGDAARMAVLLSGTMSAANAFSLGQVVKLGQGLAVKELEGLGEEAIKDGIKNIAGEKITKDGIFDAIKSTNKAFTQKLSNALAEGGKGALIGAADMGGITYMNTAFQQAYDTFFGQGEAGKGKYGADISSSETFRNAAESAFYGGLIGFGFSAGKAYMNSKPMQESLFSYISRATVDGKPEKIDALHKYTDEVLQGKDAEQVHTRINDFVEANKKIPQVINNTTARVQAYEYTSEKNAIQKNIDALETESAKADPALADANKERLDFLNKKLSIYTDALSGIAKTKEAVDPIEVNTKLMELNQKNTEGQKVSKFAKKAAETKVEKPVVKSETKAETPKEKVDNGGEKLATKQKGFSLKGKKGEELKKAIHETPKEPVTADRVGAKEEATPVSEAAKVSKTPETKNAGATEAAGVGNREEEKVTSPVKQQINDETNEKQAETGNKEDAAAQVVGKESERKKIPQGILKETPTGAAEAAQSEGAKAAPARRQQQKKEKSYAVQKQEAEKVDVRQRPGDGETLGERNTKGQEATGKGKEEKAQVVSTHDAVVEGAKDKAIAGNLFAKAEVGSLTKKDLSDAKKVLTPEGLKALEDLDRKAKAELDKEESGKAPEKPKKEEVKTEDEKPQRKSSEHETIVDTADDKQAAEELYSKALEGKLNDRDLAKAQKVLSPKGYNTLKDINKAHKATQGVAKEKRQAEAKILTDAKKILSKWDTKEAKSKYVKARYKATEAEQRLKAEAVKKYEQAAKSELIDFLINNWKGLQDIIRSQYLPDFERQSFAGNIDTKGNIEKLQAIVAETIWQEKKVRVPNESFSTRGVSSPRKGDIAKQAAIEDIKGSDYYQRSKASPFSKIFEQPKAYEYIKRTVSELFPDVKLKEVDEIKGGTPSEIIAGRTYLDALQAVVTISMNNGNLDTLPHEYMHVYVDMFESYDIVKEGIAKYGSKEGLVQAAGEEATKKILAGYEPKTWIGKWINRFYRWMKSVFTAPSVAKRLGDAFLAKENLGTKEGGNSSTVYYQKLPAYYKGFADSQEKKTLERPDTRWSHLNEVKGAPQAVRTASTEGRSNKIPAIAKELKDRIGGNVKDALKEGRLKEVHYELSHIIKEKLSEYEQLAKIEGQDMNIIAKSRIDKLRDFITSFNEEQAKDLLKALLPENYSAEGIGFLTEELEPSDEAQKAANTFKDILANSARLKFADSHLAVEATEIPFKDGKGSRRGVNWIDKEEAHKKAFKDVEEHTKSIDRSVPWLKYPLKLARKTLGAFDLRTVSELIGGGEGTMFHNIIYHPFRKSSIDFVDHHKALLDHFTKVFDEKTMNWARDPNKGGDAFDVKTYTGDYKLNKSEALSIYSALMQEHYRDSHLDIVDKDGVVAKESKGFNFEREGMDKMQMSEADWDAFKKQVESDPEMMKVYEGMKENMAAAHDIISPVYETLTGLGLGEFKNYFPVHFGTTADKTGALPNKKFAELLRNIKERIGNDDPILVGDFFQTMQHYNNSAAFYASKAIPIHNLKLFLNGKTGGVSNTAKLREMGMTNVVKYLNEYLNMEENYQLASMANQSKVYRMLMNNWIASKLAFNPSPILKQVPAMALAGSEFGGNARYMAIGTKAVAKFMAKGFSKWKMPEDFQAYQEIKEHSPLIYGRAHSTGSAAVAELMYAWQGDFTKGGKIADMVKNKDVKSLLEFTKQKGMEGIRIADFGTIIGIWEMSKAYVKDVMPEAKEGSAEYWRAVENKASEAMINTQQTYDQPHRAGLQRSTNPIVKVFTIFQSQQFKNLGMLVSSMNEFAKDGSAKNLGIMRRRYVNVLMWNALFISAADMLLSKSDKDKDSILEASMKNNLENIPLLGNFGEAVWNRAEGKRYRDVESPIEATYNDAVTAVSGLAKGQFEKNIDRSVRLGMTVVGAPEGAYRRAKQLLGN